MTAIDVPTCPIEVHRGPMVHGWNQLTFLHWEFDPAVVQRRLPAGLRVDTFDGRAWVGLVPFVMQARAARGPAIPWLSNFCETNVRTYVTAADGTRGVWFLSLEAARLAAVVTARTAYRLPYFWASMRYDRTGDDITYTSRRRWPTTEHDPPNGATSRVRIRVGAPFGPDELGERDHFLTARWRLYSATRHGLRFALAEHAPWALHRAELLDLDDELIVAAGLPQPTGDPMVHWSPGVEVRIGYPHRLAGAAAT